MIKCLKSNEKYSKLISLKCLQIPFGLHMKCAIIRLLNFHFLYQGDMMLYWLLGITSLQQVTSHVTWESGDFLWVPVQGVLDP